MSPRLCYELDIPSRSFHRFHRSGRRPTHEYPLLRTMTVRDAEGTTMQHSSSYRKLIQFAVKAAQLASTAVSRIQKTLTICYSSISSDLSLSRNAVIRLLFQSLDQA